MISINTNNGHQSVKGIIFDLDGTLIRSVVDFPKMKHMMIEYINSLAYPGANYSPKQTTNEIISDLAKIMDGQAVDLEEQETIFREISEILTEVEFDNIDKIELLPGVTELINICWDSNIKMGILTRASEKYTQECLRLTGLGKYFHSVVTRDKFNILKAKPDQHALNFIVNELSIDRKYLLFVGDHKIDLICAREGNLKFIGVLAGAYDKNILKELGADIIVDDCYALLEFLNLNAK
jgi:HAD superfamily hydrolase (TIGR01549 family)